MDDNPKVGITLVFPRLLEYSLPQVVGVDRGIFIESSTISFHKPFTYNQEGTNIYTFNQLFGKHINVVNIFEFLVGPLSKGELCLRSWDFNEDIYVRFNYFSHPQDAENYVEGSRTIKRVQETIPASFFIRPFIGSLLPVNTSDHKALEAFFQMKFSTSWKYHNGCQVDNVVNDIYQVPGIDSFRVIDGSTFKRSPGSNPQASVMMLGQ
jgi:hypothetical protein